MMEFNLLKSAVATALTNQAILKDHQTIPATIILEITGPAKVSDIIEVTCPTKTSEVIRIIAPDLVWESLFSKAPPVGYHSLGALRRQCPTFVMDGSPLTIAQCLPFLERLFEATRNHLFPKTERPINWFGLEKIIGSYQQISRSGQPPYWLYQEKISNKSMPALVMLHTAGADSRQWHGLMTQPSFCEAWSLYSFDLPGHGRSPLPPHEENWNWSLNEAHYLKWIIDFLDCNKLEKVVLMGCSMGAAIGLALTAKYPNRIHGCILLETPYRSPGRRSEFLNHAQVHGGRLGSAWVGSLLSPTSAKSRRDVATWIYSQGAPSVYDGDLAFYSDQFDASQYTGNIDNKQTPLWLFTGDYDYSASPIDTLKVVAEVEGSNFRELKGFGHFPMVEDPEGLLPFLEEAFLDIKKNITN